jgi:hypothetical protein
VAPAEVRERSAIGDDRVAKFVAHRERGDRMYDDIGQGACLWSVGCRVSVLGCRGSDQG